jgi:hypothetical protein
MGCTHGEDQRQAEGKRKERDGRWKREQPGPLGVGNLVDCRKRTLPPARPVKKIQLTWNACQAGRDRAKRRREHQSEQRHDNAGPEHSRTAAAEGVLDQPVARSRSGGAHQSCPRTGASA